MRKAMKLLGIIAISFLAFSVVPAYCEDAPAQEEKQSDFTDGMKQGDFAKALIKAVDAQGLLPAAPVTKDYFKLLEKLGLVPSGGWDVDGTIDKEFLRNLLGMSVEEASDLTFDQLLDLLTKKLYNVLWSMGIKSVAPQTISPTGG